MRSITFLQPRQLTFGAGCVQECINYIVVLPEARVHIVSSPSLKDVAFEIQQGVQRAGCVVTANRGITAEPTISAFEEALTRARESKPTCIVGVGGGSPLDVAKLIASFVDNEQNIRDTFGIGLLGPRTCHLVCVPTTSGTGSEVSPNAILLDEASHMKKGVVSPHLVPDATFVDPALTYSMPPGVTTFTGLDALTHCVEAYTNIFAHPLVDLYALRGIELCARHLVDAGRDGTNAEARAGMSQASLYGGLCLGPVNTAAVHALAYPLGGEFHIAHGLSNALLLPAVFRFNAEASPKRHAEVAVALGAKPGVSNLETALKGADLLAAISEACGLTLDLGQHGVSRKDVPRLAKAALSVTRLMKNNPRALSQMDVERIYLQCFA
jgi:alcohol dehydrogenase